MTRVLCVGVLVFAGGCGQRPAAPMPTALPDPTAVPGPQPQVAVETERLNGRWRAIAITATGLPVSKERVDAIQLDWVFEGDRVTLKRPDRPDSAGTFTTDQTASPKRMTIEKPGLPPMKAVYEIDGAKLRVCLSVPDNAFSADFPPQLASTAAPKTDLLTLERR